MIEIKNLKKQYDNITPIEDITLTINEGDVISVIGPSGTGKSTFIRCINLLERPTSGQILYNGTDITVKTPEAKRQRQKIGMVFQSFNLFGHLTVIENLMLAPMDLLGKSRQEAYDTGIEYLKRVGLKDKALSYPDELSGGQKQRVAIARTLCMDPEVILFDEPTSALDPTMVSEVQAVIRELSKSGKTMMIVTHEMNFAKAISNRVLYLDEGGIYEEGTPEEIFNEPKRENTRRFVRRLRVFEADIDSKDYDFIGLDAKLKQYLMQNDVPVAEKNRIEHAIEELIRQILIPEITTTDIHFAVEYSEQDKRTNISIVYGGDMYDFRNSDNDISLMILNNTAEEIEYNYDEDEKTNTVNIRIKSA
ncbi:MAG: amino acid ABC transporter ATP-binding protein [Lachnospiraceae bacterium]|nr:amino acid ABC transporter ATP-binding protein [Lachnospiraceae bacterium]